jgi:hypothetical protein
MDDSLKIIGLERQYLGLVKDFTDQWIGINYYSLDELEVVLDLSCHLGLSCSYLALVNGELAGVRLSFAPGKWISKGRGLSLKMWSCLPEEMGYFKSLFVSQKFQKMGIGGALSLRSLQTLSEMGAKAVLCHSWLESPGNSSQLYLQKMGFEAVKEHPRYWYPVDYLCTRCGPERCVCTAIEMVKYLKK